LLEKPGQSENFQAHVFVQREKLRLELLADLNDPLRFHYL
jgi:hypothetical protein